MKVCIVGAGAIGGFIGTRLAAAGRAEVSAVARGATLAALQEHGWRLDTAQGRVTAPARASDRPEDLGVQDLVVIAVKGPALTAVAQGIADPARNRPFLSTLDMFRLKGIGKGTLAARYLALDEAGRRRMLDGEIARLPGIMVDPTAFKTGTPVMIDTLEWFESPADLVRVMDWLRRNTEGPGGADARAILSKNPGVTPEARSKWQWIGYKGGSEPGVMNMTLLLQAKSGAWYVVTASWNDPTRDVEQARFASLISKVAEVMEP